MLKEKVANRSEKDIESSRAARRRTKEREKKLQINSGVEKGQGVCAVFDRT